MRPGQPREQLPGPKARERGEAPGQVRRVLVLRGVRVQAQVHVGKRVTGDEVDRVIGRRAAIAARERAGKRRDRDRDDQDDDGDEARDDRESTTGVDAEGEPELAHAAGRGLSVLPICGRESETMTNLDLTEPFNAKNEAASSSFRKISSVNSSPPWLTRA